MRGAGRRHITAGTRERKAGSDHWLQMPYALFCDDEKISKAFPTEADVWAHARENGLVVDVRQKSGGKTEELLDNDYRILPCEKDGEDPERNEREAREAAEEARSLTGEGFAKLKEREQT